jgi:hypothetical protein
MTTTSATISTPVDVQQLPTVRSLARSSVMATAVAAILAVTCVLPAEFAIDPTGVGRVLGLTQMGEIKRDAEAKRAKKASVSKLDHGLHVASGPHIMNDAAPIGGAWAQLAQAAPAASTAQKASTLEIVIPPNVKMELKAWMKKGDGYSFSWTASSPINFNFHGEKFNARDDEYTEYKKGIAATDKGDFKAGYDGTHGWSWRNRTKEPITVKATVTGTFEKFAEKK